jgi:hypothetical protein
MKLNFFKKAKTGWELTDLMDSLKNESSKLLDYTKSYSLSAINPTKDKFVIIRKFAAREFEGKIDMLNSSDIEGGEHYPISQFGMTLVSISDSGASSHNVILPNSLDYQKVELNEETITINHSDGITITNFKEINSLWTLENLEQYEILNRFNSLKNFIEEPHEVERHTESSIENDFFGQLMLNKELDWYEVSKDGIEFSFTNTAFETLTKNFEKMEKLIPQLSDIENQMIEEMLALKNESWLEEGDNELSKDEFQKEIKLYGVNTYQDGSAEIYYKANDLFWGHEIQTSIDNEQKYESSTIVG